MAMEAQAPPFPTAGLGPRQLSCFHSTCNDNQHQCVFWSTFCNDLTAADEDGVIKNEIKCCLWPVLELLPGGSLVQFWGLVNIGDKLCLTTCDHPFALSYFNNDYAESTIKRICEYRQHCLKYLMPTVDDADEISVDGVQQLTDGPPGRVFRSGLPEYAPQVHHYTSKEYPQRDYAVGPVDNYWAGNYWASPVYHPARHYPCGVLEIVSTSAFHIHPKEMLAKLQNPLRAVNLTPTYVSLAEVSSCQKGEIVKIDEVLMVMNMTHELHDTEIWTTSGEILSSHYGKDFVRKGQGVVGKAFSSKSACFCRDVRQLSITDYPLVPKARKNQDSACFAVCLQSSCSNNFIYVLEFFLPMNGNDYGDPRTLLRMLIETLKECLQNSFEIASGRELGQKLTVEVIKVSPKDEFDSFEICNTTGIESTPMVIEVKEEEGMMQLGFSSQQVDAANASINGIHGCQMGIVGPPSTPDDMQDFFNAVHLELLGSECTTSKPAVNCIYEQQNGPVGHSIGQNIVGIVHEEPIAEMNVVDPEIGGASNEKSGNEVTNMKKKKSDYTLKSSLGITRELLELNSTRNLNDAAKVLGVSRSTLKRILREYGIPRWPPRKAKEVNQAFAEQKVVEPSTKDIKELHQSDATRLEDNSSIWVKAEYQSYKIKFRLPFSACKADLDEKVAQRFNLSIGSFKIEYQDEENDWYMIPCDEDLSTAMSTLSSVGRTEIKMRIS